jgi:mRNA-degrading endonuclease RelE of RelBE toxin-antitoxin system
MYQVTFSEQSMRELNKLDKLEQMLLIEPISNLTPEELAHPREPLGKFRRGRTAYYRLRSGDYRLYFQTRGETLTIQYILHKNTLSDFLFRTKLPVSEEQMVEQHSSFWKYLESLKK